ncbi:amine dehydrogenase [Thioclava sp. BHET1]|uniref:Methylamine dehydrogenase (amicyanin) n=1 Tax=Thioclava dalianensis TaxID=1185766 RepID=A0A074TDV5_9RHOB|nr:methylamine dehydrogenase light chain [Thioclava dalianensis]KEP69956.1 amine dehydrogenase [Thioclava dalianensis]TMV92314.1 amine dehydrogenase [Thioclava sp. BHET1]SFN18090.1 methylamine dehydrogenase light chain [Thioclava dalianensis]
MTRIFDRFIKRLEGASEKHLRVSARKLGRRSFIAQAGTVLMGSAVALPVLPFDRRAHAAGTDEGSDPCTYWRHCAIDGFLCEESGGSLTSCPPGSSVSAVSWVGTCNNPEDGKDYLISYNDCCGKPLVPTASYCYMNKGERPGYRMGLYNDVNWCMANTDKGYHCTVSVVMGLAD